MKRDPWEDIRHATVDQLITKAKLSGSGFALNGHTTPEGWPFTVLLAVGSPGNELALEFAREACAKLAAAASGTQYRFNPKGSLIDQAVAKEREACARVVEKMYLKWADEDGGKYQVRCDAARDCAAAIRARSEK